jgi:phosphatidylglycerol:prolipoprotein diacylglycerol transferase
MLIHPQFDPVALSLGPLQVHWYGLTYLVAFGLFLFLARRRLQHPGVVDQGWQRQDVEDLLFYGVLGVVIGGRLGYALFYKPAEFLAAPLDVFKVWQGGMSFHGGLLGVVAAMAWFAHRRGRPWQQVTDLIAPCVPLGLASGRVGNFINGELWGRLADEHLPWAMAFPQSGSLLPRHPSQVYQFLLEGLLLFVVLWVLSRRTLRLGQMSGAFLMGYGACRFVAEFFREPDGYLGLLALNLSMGQWLCVPMLVAGVLLWIGGARGGLAGRGRSVGDPR